MKIFLVLSFSLLGSCVASLGLSQEAVWQPKLESPPGPLNGVALGKPLPLNSSEVVGPIDGNVQKAGFSAITSETVNPVVRAQISDVFQEVGNSSILEKIISQDQTPPPLKGNFPPMPAVLGPEPGPVSMSEDLPPPLGSEGIIFWDEIGGARERFYLRGEYLAWWLQGQRLPPLVTTSPPTLPENDLGVLGNNTTILFGNTTQNPKLFSGGRLTGGYWLDPCQLWAVEGNFFYFAPQNNQYSFNSSTNPVLARPIFIQNFNNMPSRELTATPGLSPDALFQLRGNIAINQPTQFWGSELNARRNLCCGCDYRIDLIGGFRYLDLKEGLQIVETLTTLKDFPTPSANPPVQVLKGDSFVSTDLFETHNQFYGGQVGASGEYRWGRLIFGGTAKLALGVMQESLDIMGTTTLIQAATGNHITEVGGLYAQQSNIGHYTQSKFAVVPEVGLKIGYQVTDHINAFVGYNFLYASSVLRPGNQIDQSIDIRQSPFGVGQNVAVPAVSGVQHPVALLQESSFWAQGVNVGIEIRY